ETPPRVPRGAPSTWRSWLVVLDMENVTDVGLALASPSASTMILFPARMYPSRTAGENDCASEILSNPSLRLSGGSSAPTSTSRPNRSCTDRAYSVWLSRWNERHPGFG